LFFLITKKEYNMKFYRKVNKVESLNLEHNFFYFIFYKELETR